MLRQFLDDLAAQRLRTLLTVLGITWGTVAVVVLLAFGTGLGAHMKKEAAGLGDGIVILFGGRTTRTFQGFPDGRYVRLAEEDAVLLAREIPEIEALSPEYQQRWPARRGEAATNPMVTGVAPAYGDLRNIVVEPGGRFLDAPDVAGRRRVVVLGDEVKRLLFGTADAIGEQVFVRDVPFTVVGVMEPKAQNSSYGARDKDRVFVPYSTYRAIFGTRTLNNVILRPADPARSAALRPRIYEVLGRRYTFDPADRDALGVWDTNEMMKMFGYIFLGFNVFLGVVGSFTLTVGGIGVANIMYVVVRERTREIGIKRSIGATRRVIMAQFLFETCLIVGVGAALGFLISWLLVTGLGMLPIQEYVGEATISPGVVGMAVALLAAIALAAGLFPARKAANLDPVECLRY